MQLYVLVLLSPEVEWDRSQFVDDGYSEAILGEVHCLDLVVAGVASLDANTPSGRTTTFGSGGIKMATFRALRPHHLELSTQELEVPIEVHGTLTWRKRCILCGNSGRVVGGPLVSGCFRTVPAKLYPSPPRHVVPHVVQHVVPSSSYKSNA